jgi:hypothetical protein
MKYILGSHFEESVFEPFCIECETYFVVDERTCSGYSEFCECPKCRYRCTCGQDVSSLITIDKEILIDSLCEEFGITEGKMRRAIDLAINFKKQRSELRHELWKEDPLKENPND